MTPTETTDDTTLPAPLHTPAVAELLRHRADLIARAVALDAERATVLKQVRALEAGIRVLAPGTELERERRRQPWRVRQTEADALLDIGRSVLTTLRIKKAAMTVPEIVGSLMVERKIEAGDRVHRSALREKVGLYLRKQAMRPRAVVRRVDGSDERMPLWEIVPLDEVRTRLKATS